MKKTVIKMIAALLCVCMLIPLYSCMTVNAEEPLTGEEMAEKYFKFDLAPVGDEKYAVSTLIQGLKWGMDWNELATVLDLNQGAKESGAVKEAEAYGNNEWSTGWGGQTPKITVSMDSFNRDMENVTIYVAKPVEYEDVTFKGGLYMVKVDYRNEDSPADTCPYAGDFERYYADKGGLTEDNIRGMELSATGAVGHGMYGGMDCDGMDMTTLTWQEFAVMNWLLEYWTYEEEDRMPKLAAAMAESDEVVPDALQEKLGPVTCIEYAEYKTAQKDGTHSADGSFLAQNRTELYKAAREIVARYNELHA